MSEAVLVALISAGGLVAVAVLTLVARVSIKITRVAADAAETRNQVANDHKTNMREESDERHNENSTMLGEILHRLESVEYAVRHAADLGIANRHSIEEIERTIPPSKLPGRPGRHSREATP